MLVHKQVALLEQPCLEVLFFYLFSVLKTYRWPTLYLMNFNVLLGKSKQWYLAYFFNFSTPKELMRFTQLRTAVVDVVNELLLKNKVPMQTMISDLVKVHFPPD